MSEDAPAQAPVQDKSPKKKRVAVTQKKAPGPSIQKLVLEILKDSTERRGFSVTAIKKLLAGKGVELDKCNKRVNVAIKKLVTSGDVVQTTGSGASGSLKLAKKEPVKKVVKVAKKSPVKAKKPAAKKSPVKKAVVKKTASKKIASKKIASKKPAAKKAAPKAKVAAKPAKKVTKKPVEKKSVKAVRRSPKKVAAKKPVKKTSAAKKSKK